LRALAEHRGSVIEMDLAEPEPRVATDARRVRQILLNLLSNALKFGGGRPVVLRCTSVPEGGAKIAITDRGRGIAPEDRERIFEDFVQVGDHRELGSGLGLSISQRLATLLGGTLEVESEPEKGSTFWLTLPPAPPQPTGTGNL
jgi:signal transduction histidine kinase